MLQQTCENVVLWEVFQIASMTTLGSRIEIIANKVELWRISKFVKDERMRVSFTLGTKLIGRIKLQLFSVHRTTSFVPWSQYRMASSTKTRDGLILAVDQGTSSTRSILFNHKGEALFSHQVEFDSICPKQG
jgi:hypothetical protein